MCCLFFANISPALAYKQYSFVARGRTYTVTTTAIANSGFTFSGHWMYQPSVVLPSGLTANRHIMLFNSNFVEGKTLTDGEAVWSTSSPDGHSNWTLPQAILKNSAVDNICDMADARPIWDGTQWRVYVQAVEGNYSSGSCQATNHVFMAVGSSLSSQLQWVKEPGTNSAKKVLIGTGAGIAEDMQWFYTAPYGGPPNWPFQATYQNWGYGVDLFSYLYDQGMYTAGYWWGPVAIPQNGPPWFDSVGYSPDAILMDSLDAVTNGHPAISFASTCQITDHRYHYSVGLAYFPNPLSNSTQAGTPYPGPLESTSSDSNGPRMFRPRIARNEHGFLPLSVGSGGGLRIWKTYIYYNDTQINRNSGDVCSAYTRWDSSDQRFRVSELMIWEQ